MTVQAYQVVLPHSKKKMQLSREQKFLLEQEEKIAKAKLEKTEQNAKALTKKTYVSNARNLEMAARFTETGEIDMANSVIDLKDQFANDPKVQAAIEQVLVAVNMAIQTRVEDLKKELTNNQEVA